VFSEKIRPPISISGLFVRIFDCPGSLRPGQSGPACGRMPSDSQALAALGTAGIDDLAAVLGAHTGQKAVDLLALALLGLESSLHSRFLLKVLPPGCGVAGCRFCAPVIRPGTVGTEGT